MHDVSRTSQLAQRRGCDPRWIEAIRHGFGHRTWGLTEGRAESPSATLPLSLVSTPWFGRFLVSLPFINTAGIESDDEASARGLVDRAIVEADRLNVRYLELRGERAVPHERLVTKGDAKVHMRLALPGDPDVSWKQLDAKVRNQVRKGDKSDLTAVWGSHDLLNDFYCVFSVNMRDLGTPVFGRRLFAAILDAFGSDAELCVVRHGDRPVAGALLVHGTDFTEVPSASALRAFNSTNANMWMYWHLLRRAIERGKTVFDFGRSSPESGTYRFKKQWGAQPFPAVWQYYVRSGSIGDMRPENKRFSMAISVWRRLPVWFTRIIGPPIVRGIP
ncbi:MAG: FemAB family PEP-CTERM system-associated protein [Planctomycetes bacterium]|nr:FemAB family PEP-CTERM system-associated protein [Planctomycetota bacterium]